MKAGSSLLIRAHDTSKVSVCLFETNSSKLSENAAEQMDSHPLTVTHND